MSLQERPGMHESRLPFLALHPLTFYKLNANLAYTTLL